MRSMKKYFVGVKLFQSFFERLFRISLRGMNYGVGGTVETSGELYIINYIKGELKNKNPVIFDVGANHGQYLSSLLGSFKENCIIYSFEPSKACMKSLEKFHNKNVYIHNLALSSKAGEMELNYDHVGSVLASVYQGNQDHYSKNFTLSEKIEAITLDEFCKSENIRQVDFLKIDVEGHEFDVLQGAENFLKNNRIRFIQFEFGPGSMDGRVYLKYFFNLLCNYDIYRILKNGIQKINYHERYEIFLTSNYLAINKEYSNSGV